MNWYWKIALLTWVVVFIGVAVSACMHDDVGDGTWGGLLTGFLTRLGVTLVVAVTWPLSLIFGLAVTLYFTVIQRLDVDSISRY